MPQLRPPRLGTHCIFPALFVQSTRLSLSNLVPLFPLNRPSESCRTDLWSILRPRISSFAPLLACLLPNFPPIWNVRSSIVRHWFQAFGLSSATVSVCVFNVCLTSPLWTHCLPITDLSPYSIVQDIIPSPAQKDSGSDSSPASQQVMLSIVYTFNVHNTRMVTTPRSPTSSLSAGPEADHLSFSSSSTVRLPHFLNLIII